jgi:hypothetical protein
MTSAAAFEDKTTLVGTLVIKTDKGVGARSDVSEEVVHMSLAFYPGEVIESEDPQHPYCFHSSRLAMLELAENLRRDGCLAAFGLDGDAMKLVIPGIPFPLGNDFQGDQREDVGGHLSLYNRPANAKDGDDYSPPDLLASKKLEGETYTLTLDPLGTHILVASESNDMKTGCAYYLGVSFDDESTATVVDIQTSLGLPVNRTQRHHMSLAGLAPAWQPLHPKSLRYRSMDGERKVKTNLQNDFQIFRKGDTTQRFIGFNCDSCTGWTTHANASANLGKNNAAINSKVKELEKTEQSDGRDADIANLKSGLKNILAELGYPSSVGARVNDKVSPEAFRAAAPNDAAQKFIMAQFSTSFEGVPLVGDGAHYGQEKEEEVSIKSEKLTE